MENVKKSFVIGKRIKRLQGMAFSLWSKQYTFTLREKHCSLGMYDNDYSKQLREKILKLDSDMEHSPTEEIINKVTNDLNKIESDLLDASTAYVKILHGKWKKV
jgi:ABC-type multidrug transport system fused ATPase/permease subunit